MKRAAPGPIDCVLDLLPPSAGTAPVRAAAMAVRECGRVVLMGGVGMLGGDDLALPYPWIMRNCITIIGQWMYPATANARLIALARSGLLDLRHWEVASFGLDAANEAVTHRRQRRSLPADRSPALTAAPCVQRLAKPGGCVDAGENFRRGSRG